MQSESMLPSYIIMRKIRKQRRIMHMLWRKIFRDSLNRCLLKMLKREMLNKLIKQKKREVVIRSKRKARVYLRAEVLIRSMQKLIRKMLPVSQSQRQRPNQRLHPNKRVLKKISKRIRINKWNQNLSKRFLIRGRKQKLSR
jgi:hypothetical protein